MTNSLSRFEELRAKTQQAAEKKAKRAAKRKTLFRGKPKLKSRKWYVRHLDQEFSRQVRAKYSRCFHCLGKVEHCFHFLTRKNYSTRWDFENAVASCASCNYRYEYESDFINDIIEDYKFRHGVDKWTALVRRHHTPTKFSRSDLAAMLDKLKKEAPCQPAN